MMDCIKIEELLPAYTLGSLSSTEADNFNAHVDSCGICAIKVREAGDTLVNLARMVPQERPSERVKDRLFARIDQVDEADTRPSETWLDAARSLGRQLTLSPGTSLAVAFLVVAVVVGYWSSRSLQDLQDLRGDIEQRMESVAQQEQDLREGLEQQHKLFATIASDPRCDDKASVCGYPDRTIAWARVPERCDRHVAEGKHGHNRRHAPATATPKSGLPRLAHQARRAGDLYRNTDHRFDRHRPCRNSRRRAAGRVSRHSHHDR